MNRKLASFLLIPLVAGCAYSKLEAPVGDAELEIGISTKRDVYEYLGQPHDVVIAADGTTSMWSYYDGHMDVHPFTMIPFVGMVVGGPIISYEFHELHFDQDSQKLTAVSSNENRDYVSMWADSEQRAQIGLAAERVRQEMDVMGLEFDQELAERVEKYDVLLYEQRQKEE